MVERRRELNARYTKKRKMRKLKAKLVAPNADKAAILAKIKKMSPAWTEAALVQAKGEPLAPSAAPHEHVERKKPAGPPQRGPKKA